MCLQRVPAGSEPGCLAPSGSALGILAHNGEPGVPPDGTARRASLSAWSGRMQMALE